MLFLLVSFFCLYGSQAAFVPVLRSGIEASYQKIGENKRCDDTPITANSAESWTLCKNRCSADERCWYVAFYTRRKFCETYQTCSSQSPDRKHPITLWKKNNDCEDELGDGNGRYYSMIAAEFSPGLISATPPGKNLHCFCIFRSWMECVIFAIEGSEVEEEALARLDGNRNNPMALLPFVVTHKYEDEEGPMSPFGIVHPESQVFAEIDVFDADRCQHVDMCLKGTPGGICPVERTRFQSGEPVYIILNDLAKAVRGIPVPCISVSGLRKRLPRTEIQGHTFHDPFGREKGDGTQLLPGSDYYIFFIFSNIVLNFSGFLHSFHKKWLVNIVSSPFAFPGNKQP